MDDRICAARLKASVLFPYFSSGLFALIPIETDNTALMGGMKTMGVDKRWRMIYHIGIFDEWTIDEVAVAMIHEVMHLLRDHPERAAISLPEEHIIWNIAADCEINDDLKDYSLPKGVCFPSTFNFPEGLTAEEYFQLLKNNAQKVSIPKPSFGSGQCGGCATGEGEDGDVKDEKGNVVHGVSSLEKEVMKNAVARDIIEGAGRGNAPSGMVRWAEQQLKSTVPWRTILSGCVRGVIGNTSGMVNYCYSRPSRRQSIFGKIIMPSLRAPLPNIAMLIDTSGSMSDKDLGIAVAEIDGVLRSLGVSVTVISNDAEVGAVKRVRSAKDVQLVGGGGTNLGPGIAKSAELKPNVNFLIIVSDCDACWGDYIPHFPVIVVKVGGSSSMPPEWITRVVKVDD
jgi:predicted metal-dependent peptidase